MTDLHERALELLALREKATPGPWRHDADTFGDPDDVSIFASEDFISNMGVPVGCVAFDVQPNNGRFIAAAHDMADLIRDQDAQIDALLAENERLAKAVSKFEARPVGPDRCPFTGREFWGNITHPELGEVATYGGPFDTYTLPARTDDDEEYFVRRFDHDRGHWLLDDMEFIGLKLVDDQLYTSEDDPAELRAENERLAAERDALHRMSKCQCSDDDACAFATRAAAAEARYKALCEAEPWAYGAEIDGKVWVTTSIHGRLPDARALIPRPSMEKTP